MQLCSFICLNVKKLLPALLERTFIESKFVVVVVDYIYKNKIILKTSTLLNLWYYACNDCRVFSLSVHSSVNLFFLKLCPTMFFHTESNQGLSSH